MLGGWTAAPSLCKLGLFVSQTWKSSTVLEVSYAEMDVYPPDASGATPARLHTDVPVTLSSDFVTDVQRSGSYHTIVANPERYETGTVEAIRAVAKGFAAQSK